MRSTPCSWAACASARRTIGAWTRFSRSDRGAAVGRRDQLVRLGRGRAQRLLDEHAGPAAIAVSACRGAARRRAHTRRRAAGARRSARLGADPRGAAPPLPSRDDRLIRARARGRPRTRDRGDPPHPRRPGRSARHPPSPTQVPASLATTGASGSIVSPWNTKYDASHRSRRISSDSQISSTCRCTRAGRSRAPRAAARTAAPSSRRCPCGRR